METVILGNEILFRKYNEVIYLTINLEDELLGIYSDQTGHIIKPIFKHVFANTQNKKNTGCVDGEGRYVWLYSNGSTKVMNESEVEEWANYIPKAYRCNCTNVPQVVPCTICGGFEMIYTSFGDRFLDEFFD